LQTIRSSWKTSVKPSEPPLRRIVSDAQLRLYSTLPTLLTQDETAGFLTEGRTGGGRRDGRHLGLGRRLTIKVAIRSPFRVVFAGSIDHSARF
jgi:hypothetical protein